MAGGWMRIAAAVLAVAAGAVPAAAQQARLEQYHCWGQPILAPGAGTVVTAVDSLADQQPEQMDPRNAAGNHVVLDHGNGEFSLLAHLRRGSVEGLPAQFNAYTADGQPVARGEPVQGQTIRAQ